MPAYTTPIATPDPSCVCDLHNSSWQRRILNPLSEARDGTLDLMVPSWICFHCAVTGTSDFGFFYLCISDTQQNSYCSVKYMPLNKCGYWGARLVPWDPRGPSLLLPTWMSLSKCQHCTEPQAPHWHGGTLPSLALGPAVPG